MTLADKSAMLRTAAALAALLLLPTPGFAQVALGAAGSYTVLSGSAISNIGATAVRGDLGVSPGSAINGLPVGQPTSGSIHAGDSMAAQAQSDLGAAYALLAAESATATMSHADLCGTTLGPGVYRFPTAAALSGTLTLDAHGDSSAVFVFQIGTALTTAAGASVVLAGGAQVRHVWWQVGTAATLGIGSAMQGNLLARTSITLGNRASVTGRVLAQKGSVTMNANSLVDSATHVTFTALTTWSLLKSQYR